MNILETLMCAAPIAIVVLWIIYGVIQIRKISHDDDITKVDEQLEVVKNIIDSLVLEENQLQVDKWKALSKNGKLTDEQAKQAFDQVYNDASAIIASNRVLNGVLDIFADQDGLKILIEESVNKNKTSFAKLETIQANDIISTTTDTSSPDTVIENLDSDDELY